jgi:hypothetical protein
LILEHYFNQQLIIYFYQQTFSYHSILLFQMSEALKDVPIWDISKSQTLAFLRFWPEFVDHAVLVGQESSIDGLGVAPSLFTVAAFTAYFGQAPQPRPVMAPPAGNAVQLCLWKEQNEKTNKLNAGNIYIRNVLLNQVPAHIIAPMRDVNRSIRVRTTEYICTRLVEELGTLTAPDIAYLEAKLKAPYQSGAPIPCFLAEWTANWNDLARAGQPIADFAATTMLRGCFDGIREFTKCWLQLMQTFPLVADRTVPRHCAAIITFARDALPLLTAHSAIGISAVTDQTRIIIDLQAQLERALSAKKVKKRGQTSSPEQAPKHAREAQSLSARPFCWSHGPRGHLGHACTDPLPGHQPDATWAHQKGSKWKELFGRRGWSTA